MDTKICIKCGKEKNVEEFSFRKDTNKYKNTCKECVNKAHREYRLTHTKEMREKDKAFYNSHKEARKQQNKKYVEQNKEKVKDYKKEYYYSHRDEILAKHKAYSKANKDRLSNYLKEYYKEHKAELFAKQKEYNEAHKEERKAYYKKYKSENLEKIKKSQKAYYEINKEKILDYQNSYRLNNPEKVKVSQQKTYSKRKEKPEYIKQKKEYRLANIDKEKSYMKEYNRTHRKEINEYVKNRTQNDLIYALKVHARKTIYDSFKRKKYSKNSKSYRILGCDMDTFVNHLLNTYKDIYGTDWDGKEPVHIDHINPLYLATTEEEVYELCNYKNLQLLKAKDNLEKTNKTNWKPKKKKE